MVRPSVLVGAILVLTTALEPASASTPASAAAPAGPCGLSPILRDDAGAARILAGRLAPDPTDRRPAPDRVRSLLALVAPRLGLVPEDLDETDLIEVETRTTALGTTVRFQRRRDGLPLEPGELVTQLDPEGNLVWVAHDGPVDGFDVTGLASAPGVTADEVLAAALADLGVSEDLAAPPGVERVLAWEGGAPEVQWVVTLAARQPRGDWEIRLDRDGRVLSRRDTRAFARARVFLANPVVAMRDPTLRDGDDSAEAVPEAAYSEVDLQGLDDSGTLTGEWVSTEASAVRAFEPDGVFAYRRDDPRFEEVVAYHAIDTLQRAIQAAGVTGALQKRIVVDVHATEDDQSWYSRASRGLHFGSGGVDDAEDAEIVWHEYGHALQDDQVPAWGSTPQARAMGEGFGDYLAAAMAERVSDFQVECAGDWDSTAYSKTDPPCLRRLDSAKRFPRDLTGMEHQDGELWSACLWQIHGGIGDPAAALRTIVSHHFLLTRYATMQKAALAMLATDLQLSGGANARVIRRVFTERGILPPAAFLELALRDPAGSPVRGSVRVASGAGGPGPGPFEVPAATGFVRLEVAPGPVVLEITAGGHAPPEPLELELGLGDERRVELVLEPLRLSGPAGRVPGSTATGDLPARVRISDRIGPSSYR